MVHRGIRSLTSRPRLAVALRYGLAAALVAIALAISFIAHLHNSPPSFVSHFVLLAIASSLWGGGAGPGCVGVARSCRGVTVFARNRCRTRGGAVGQCLGFRGICSLLMS